MDYIIGEVLSLKFPAINPENQGEILFPTGTKAVIQAIKGQVIDLEFPDGLTYAHDAKDLPMIFIKETGSGKILSKNHSGLGTPPKNFFQFLPEGADWKKNYVWKVSVSLEEKSDKHIICQLCTTEITDLNQKNAAGTYCPGCKDYVTPFDLDANKPLVNYDVALNTAISVDGA